MIASNYRPQTAEAVRKVGAASLVDTEQAIDMATGRTFRRSLLVAAEREPVIDRRLTAARIDGLHAVGGGTLTLAHEAVGATLSAPNGRRLHTGSAALTAALERFVAAFPGSAGVDDLVQAMPADMRNADGRALAREGLLNMVVNGLATPVTDPVPAVAAAGARPLACPLVRADASHGATAVVSLRHERVEIGPPARVVLPLLDGSRDADAIAAAVTEAAGRSDMAVNRARVDSDENLPASIALDNLNALLATFARAALLLA